MYLKYFNLSAKPFEISPDPRFLWLGEKHKEGFATLRYGILTGKGFIALTGDVGTGKTTLLNALARSFGDNFIFARIPDPSLEELDFLNYTASAFEMDKKFRGKGDFLSELTTFLNQAHADNKEVVLVVDEAQNIKAELLEEIRLISNIEKPEKKLINIIFAGQNRFNEILNNNRALRNRLAINYKIKPLSEAETERYITHRLKIAGAKSRIFSSRAIHEIYSFSKGNPRQINIISDLALLTGYTTETKEIEPAMIKECVRRTLTPFIHTEALAEKQNLPANITREPNQEKSSGNLSRTSIISLPRKKTTVSLRKTAYLAPIPLILLIGIIGLVYFPGVYNSLILKLKTYFEQAVSHYANPVSDTSLQNVQAVKVPLQSQTEQKLEELEKNLEQEKSSNYRLNAELAAKNSQLLDYQKRLEESRADQTALVADFQNKMQDARSYQAALEAELQKNLQETALLATQLKELNTQKTSAETRLENLQTAHKALAADFEELKNTRDQVAELTSALTVKDRMLTQNEQRQQELENNLAQEKDSKVSLNSELSAQTALVAELKNELEAARADQAGLQAQLQKSRQETALLKTQLKELNTKKISAETRLENLQTAHKALLADDLEELKNTRDQVAELKNELTAKDRMLTQNKQRQQELEKNLAQEKDSKDSLNSELSAQAALVADLKNKLVAARADQPERVADLQNKLETARVDQAAFEAQLQKSRQERALLKTQLQELNAQKTSAETQLENLQAEHKALAADFEELKNAQEQVAELKSELTVKDRLLMQHEQRQRDLEKDLAQAKNSKDKLNGELSAQAAQVADLQNKLETARADQAALTDKYNKSMKRTAQLQAQVQELKAKTSVGSEKPVALDLQKKPPPERKLPAEETESPNPADIIDWVLKKKSE